MPAGATAQALTWTLYLLALFPDWQDRAREEIRHVIGDGPINREKLQLLSLVEAILQEAMRLYPPAPSLAGRRDRSSSVAMTSSKAQPSSIQSMSCIATNGFGRLEAFGAKADWLRTLVCEASWKAS